jgi:uncharacterized protein DUF6152
MKATAGLTFGVLLLLTSSPAFAHHAFAVEFDASKCADITGTMTKVAYENPHAYIFVNGKSPAGEMVEMTFQLSSTSNLKRGGATFAALNGSVNKEVTVRGCLSRNGTDNRYAASFIKLADGTIQRVGQDVEGIFGTKLWR